MDEPNEATSETPKKDRLIEALKLLKDASLLMIIASLIMGIGMLLPMFGMLTMPMLPYSSMHPVMAPSEVLVSTGVIALVLVAIVGVVIGLYAVFTKLIPSTTEFAEYSPDYSTSATLVKIGYIGGLILLLVGFATLMLFVRFFVLIGALILLLIGIIGLAILSFKIHDEFKSTMFLIAGIFFLIGIFIPIIRFIAWILVYVESETLIRRVATT